MVRRTLCLRPAVWPLVLGSLFGCGRTDPAWWTDIYASGSDEADEFDASSGDESSGSESTSGPGTSTVDPDTSSTDPDTTTDPDTSSTNPDTTTTDTATTTTDTTASDTSTTECSPTAVALVASAPTVVVLLEQGAHMDQDIGTGLSIWDTVGLALFFDPAAVVPSWEDELRLGLTGFTSQNGNQGGNCPLLDETPAMPFNASAMETAWLAMQPIDENPVADALAAVSTSLAADPSPGSKAIALLSARNPDTCMQPNPQQGGNLAVAAADVAFQAGVTTRLFALGNGNLNAGYAQALADAGAGQAGATWTTSADELELAAALDEWLQTLRPCQLALDPVIAPMGADACLLTLGGGALQLDDPNGFVLEGGATLTLQGSACTDYQAAGPAALELICSCEAF